MSAEGLSEITQPVRKEYVELLGDIAIDVGVTPESITELLKVNRRQEIATLTRGKPTTIKLFVDKQFPIALDSKDEGRVFELVGRSDRNKTTSLIYMATLLGISWDDTRPFLDHDGRVYNTATQNVCTKLLPKYGAELRLTSKSYELSITVTEGRAAVSILDENRHSLPSLENESIPLTSSEDWLRYRKLMRSICDVQFVGKSRDFIGQVSIEESKDLEQFCSIVKDRVGLMLKDLQNLPKDQVYGRTEQELMEDIATLTRHLVAVRKEIDGLNQDIENQHRLIQECEELIAIHRELENSQTAEVQDVLRCLKQEETVRDLEKKRQDLERSVQDLQKDLVRKRSQLSQQEPPFNRIKSSLEALRGKISSELKNLSALNSLCGQILREIANKDYSSVLTFCTYAVVDEQTISLLNSMIETTKQFSKGLVIPFESAEAPGTKLNELDKDFSTALSRADDIQKLKPELTEAYQALLVAQVSSAQELRRLESDVDTTRLFVTSKERTLEEHQNELEGIRKNMQALLGVDDFQALQTHVNQLRQALSQDQSEMLERVERLSQGIGYNEPWQLNLSDIQSIIFQGRSRMKELEDSKASREKVESQSKDKLFNMKRSPIRSGTGRTQYDALGELQSVLLNVISYLKEYQVRREEERSYSAEELDQRKKRIGGYIVDAVHQALNRVICKRCPVMYKNRDSGPVRLPVQEYDFINSHQIVSELQDGEWPGGGGDSAMTVGGLASRSSGSCLGTLLLVDEFNDAETFKGVVHEDLTELDQLAFAIFVKQNPDLRELRFEVMK